MVRETSNMLKKIELAGLSYWSRDVPGLLKKVLGLSVLRGPGTKRSRDQKSHLVPSRDGPVPGRPGTSRDGKVPL